MPSSCSSGPLRIGIVGAGPWARAVTGRVFAAGPDTALAGVWSRTPANAQACARELDTSAHDELDSLLAASDAVAIAVAPEAQPEIAIRCARAGKALLLEKPLAVSVTDAERVVDAIDDAGVPSLLMLTNRFHARFSPFVEEARALGALGGRGCFLSGAFLPGSPYANGWRLERGALLDVGPHLIDLHDAALGAVVDVYAAGDVHGWVSLTLVHETGSTSQASLCCRAAIESRTELEVFGPGGSACFDGREGNRRDIGRAMASTFVQVARGALPSPAGARRGLELQRVIEKARAQL